MSGGRMTKKNSTAFEQHQVFIASPGDVSAERQLVEAVIAELNRTVAKSKRIFLQTRRWELDTFPKTGRDIQAIVNAQIADMSECKLFIGIIWNRLGTKTRRAASGTVEEYDRALKSFKKHGRPEIWFYFRKQKLTNPTNDQMIQAGQASSFQKQVQSENLTFTYNTPKEFCDLLRKHLILWIDNLSVASSPIAKKTYRLNPYKLYYFRQMRKMSYTEVARSAEIDRTTLRRLENENPSKKRLSSDSFPEIEEIALNALERALNCQGKLAGGQADDFLSQYLLFYDTYKRISQNKNRTQIDSRQQELRFKTQAVVFDFGGTLTQSQGKYTTWEKLWRKLNYSVNDCSELHRRYQSGEITHQQWCEITCKAFRERNLCEEHVLDIARQVRLVPGVANTIIELRKRGIRLYIVSGSLKTIIRETLGPLYNEFEEIRANDVIFDSQKIISKIQSTPYDFKGKADFLRRIVRELDISPLDVLFVGNSCNDVFASESGVRTLCVNPRFTDPDKQEHWTYSIREMTDLSQIKKYVYV